VQELLAKLEKLDQQGAAADSPELNRQRADLLTELAAAAASDDERWQWQRQLADTVSAAVQSGGFPDGVARLEELHQKLKGVNDELAAYVKFRSLTADYGQSIQEPKADIAKVQDKWLASLEEFIKEYPKSPDTAEALLQLAIAKEFAGEEDEAKEYYGRIVTDFSQASAAAKAAGAKTRLDSVGRAVPLRGMTTANKPVDISQYRGKVVLVQYWATWCEPCKNDMAQIKDLLAKYGKAGFAVLGVNLDSDRNELAAFLKQNPLPWAQIFEPGGLDSRPANELGILTLPTMFLIDEKGNVVNRNIHVSQVETELKQRLKL
jgi:thiol-disulfide isomerase/thioredoxin